MHPLVAPLILGLQAPSRFAHFWVVGTENGVSLDFASSDEHIEIQHYAFLVSEQEFDAIFGRLRQRGLSYWADPMRHRPGEINHNDGGRGVYFGETLRALTRDPDAPLRQRLRMTAD